MTPRPKADSRTLVDQFLDRIKNNRVAAVIIIVCVAVGALASLTDSTEKLRPTSYAKPLERAGTQAPADVASVSAGRSAPRR